MGVCDTRRIIFRDLEFTPLALYSHFSSLMQQFLIRLKRGCLPCSHSVKRREAPERAPEL